MVDTWKLATVTAAIASQSIMVVNAVGENVILKIQDIGTMTDAIQQSECPVLAPRPDEFCTPREGFFVRDTYGADAALKSLHYTLTYKFFFSPVLQGMAAFEKFGESVTAFVAIGLHFATHTNLSGATEFLPRLVNLLPQADMNQTLFHGGELAFDVMQFMEA